MMEFLAELLTDILGEFLLDTGVDAASNRRRPMWQRVSILALIALFFTAVLALVAAGGVMVIKDSSVLGALLLALDLALIVFSLCKLRGILRTFSRK